MPLISENFYFFFLRISLILFSMIFISVLFFRFDFIHVFVQLRLTLDHDYSNWQGYLQTIFR